MERIDRDTSDAGFNRFAEFMTSLVVAVEVDLLSREVSSKSKCQLAASNHVDVHSLFLDYLEDGRIRERLGRVFDFRLREEAPKIIHEFPAHFPDRRLVIDVERAAELFDDGANV